MKKQHSGLLIIVSPGFRVYRGITGFIDWRSHGAFTRFVKAGIFRGEDSEVLHLGEPVGPAVGSVLCVGCELPKAEVKEKESLSQYRNWFKSKKSVWEELNIQPLRWSLGEEWLGFLELWKTLFHNDQYLDVNGLKELEERNFYGISRSSTREANA